MLTEEKAREIADATVRRVEKLGDQRGGSGHLSFVTCAIDSIDSLRPVGVAGNEQWEIAFTYTKTVETEFTVYPSHPPYEERYRKTIVVDGSGNLLRETPTERDYTHSRQRPLPNGLPGDTPSMKG